eukprot:GHVP01061182.1.p1 GENE.GHVP01061182.1~~GHVP01061182.1.p1  ORF type:complete len:580 (-),score=93.85 GHVP01061182.1:263-2002(-)
MDNDFTVEIIRSLLEEGRINDIVTLVLKRDRNEKVSRFLFHASVDTLFDNSISKFICEMETKEHGQRYLKQESKQKMMKVLSAVIQVYKEMTISLFHYILPQNNRNCLFYDLLKTTTDDDYIEAVKLALSLSKALFHYTEHRTRTSGSPLVSSFFESILYVFGEIMDSFKRSTKPTVVISTVKCSGILLRKVPKTQGISKAIETNVMKMLSLESNDVIVEVATRRYFVSFFEKAYPIHFNNEVLSNLADSIIERVCPLKSQGDIMTMEQAVLSSPEKTKKYWSVFLDSCWKEKVERRKICVAMSLCATSKTKEVENKLERIAREFIMSKEDVSIVDGLWILSGLSYRTDDMFDIAFNHSESKYTSAALAILKKGNIEDIKDVDNMKFRTAKFINKTLKQKNKERTFQDLLCFVANKTDLLFPGDIIESLFDIKSIPNQQTPNKIRAIAAIICKIKKIEDMHLRKGLDIIKNDFEQGTVKVKRNCLVGYAKILVKERLNLEESLYVINRIEDIFNNTADYKVIKSSIDYIEFFIEKYPFHIDKVRGVLKKLCVDDINADSSKKRIIEKDIQKFINKKDKL